MPVLPSDGCRADYCILFAMDGDDDDGGGDDDDGDAEHKKGKDDRGNPIPEEPKGWAEAQARYGHRSIVK
jgi:hypothetical protein